MQDVPSGHEDINARWPPIDIQGLPTWPLFRQAPSQYFEA